MLHVEEYIGELVHKAKIAQRIFEHEYISQQSIDEVVRIVGKSVYDQGERLAKDAVAETGMGNMQSKLDKLKNVSLAQWNFMKGKQSVGYLQEDIEEPGVKIVAKPLGIIGCVMPSTNPIATAVGNAMMALKSRNAVIIASHPASAKVSQDTCDLMRAGLKSIGAPIDLVQCISSEEVSLAATSELLKQADVNIATGGAAMVKSVYSAGKPGFGVGQGNCQAIIDEDFDDLQLACNTIVSNRSWDLGVPCTGEQTILVHENRKEEVLKCLKAAGSYIVEDKNIVDKIRELAFPGGKELHSREALGKAASDIAKMIDLEIPKETKVIVVPNQARGYEDLLCKEILFPLLRVTTYTDFKDALEIATSNLYREGAGHSSSIWSRRQSHIDEAALAMPVGRFHVNQPTRGQNNGIPSSPTIGCGSWGNNSISENLQYYHLMNKTRVTVTINNKRVAQPSDWDEFDASEFFED